MSSPESPLQHAKHQVSLQRKTSRARRAITRDAIDKLDDSVDAGYHHEGPFDAALKSRQIKGRAPLDATRIGNELGRGISASSDNDDEKYQDEPRAHGPVEYIGDDAPTATITSATKETSVAVKKRLPGQRN
ncbi:hypothetical protein PYCC9005_003031 [Savitreella phatthalungensis]